MITCCSPACIVRRFARHPTVQVELRGFRNNLRLAAQADSSEGGDDDEEEEGEEVEGIARRAKRERGMGGGVGVGWRACFCM